MNIAIVKKGIQDEETSSSEIIRCGWVTKDPIYIAYHDEEWGKPEYNSLRLFEMLCLEGQQAGLSWITILKKRNHYRKHFFKFNPHKIATIEKKDIDKYLKNPNIVRHRGKIEAIVNNAKCFIRMQENGVELSEFLWSFVNDNKPIMNHWKNTKEIPTETAESVALAKALKTNGFKFVGSTICYAFMQACGLVNDHIVTCLARK